jgi:glycosyltransferase involved in cell wall biosynthesis
MTAQVKPTISAVICTYNRYDVLPQAIQSCLSQTLDASAFEIIVVDNSPDAESARSFGQRYEAVGNLHYLIADTPGLSNARNIALARSRAEIIAYLDDDAIASETWLVEIIEAFELYGEAAVAAGGRILPSWQAERPDWMPEQKLGYLSVVDWGGRTRVISASEWIAGANIAFRRAPLQAVGGFDVTLGRRGPETSLLSNEENDVLRKLGERGGLVLYMPNAEVLHQVDERRLHRDWFRRRSAWQAVSDYLANPDAHHAADGAFGNVLTFLLKQAPRHRSIAGLQVDFDDPDQFNEQLDAVYDMTAALLAGLKGLK